jgi:hypothetical protein
MKTYAWYRSMQCWLPIGQLAQNLLQLVLLIMVIEKLEDYVCITRCRQGLIHVPVLILVPTVTPCPALRLFHNPCKTLESLQRSVQSRQQHLIIRLITKRTGEIGGNTSVETLVNIRRLNLHINWSWSGCRLNA